LQPEGKDHRDMQDELGEGLKIDRKTSVGIGVRPKRRGNRRGDSSSDLGFGCQRRPA